MDMNVKTLTVGQLRNICKNNKFIILRHSEGFAFAINCAIQKFCCKDYPFEDEPTNFISYKSCNFDEYITLKVPFLYSN